ncbi:hypothetical protein R3P38DRAFT_2544126 [Favolaschia claudopus]|uniref:Uncharacterized protein n=1 Tax=Favolaschia claudopus TaxID=2862362 RepID=A0AAW0ANX8_9AGAR
MGSSTSKAAKTLPKRVTTPPWSGARLPRASDLGREAVSETRTDAIEQDSKDPQFLSKLNQLGTVKVDHHMQTVRTADLTKKMFDSRVQSETQADSATHTQNRLHATRLTLLLNERKSVRTRRDMEFLAQRYGVDLNKLDAIAKFVSTPSVQANSGLRVQTSDGQEQRIMTAVWVEPR